MGTDSILARDLKAGVAKLTKGTTKHLLLCDVIVQRPNQGGAPRWATDLAGIRDLEDMADPDYRGSHRLWMIHTGHDGVPMISVASIAVFLYGYGKGFEITYRLYCEADHPRWVDCPVKWLDLVPEPTGVGIHPGWRDRVRLHARAHSGVGGRPTLHPVQPRRVKTIRRSR